MWGLISEAHKSDPGFFDTWPANYRRMPICGKKIGEAWKRHLDEAHIAITNGKKMKGNSLDIKVKYYLTSTIPMDLTKY